MEKTDWEKFFMEIFNLLFEEEIQKAKEVIEKQRLVMGLPALNRNEIETIRHICRIVKDIYNLIERNDCIEKKYLEKENELKLLDEKLKRWKYKWLPFFKKKINMQREELEMEVWQIRDALETPQAPKEWREARYAYEKLASLFGFNEEWVDKIANISQIVDNFQARLIK